MNRKAQEINFDALPGPTHNYAGLAFGNTWSTRSLNQRAYPQKAALQSLQKMHLLASLGLPQAFLPPPPRPNLGLLSQLGFTGPLTQQLDKAHKQAPKLLAACYSSSAMWAANSATVSPSADTLDGKVHFTPANLVTHFHRSLEQDFTTTLLRQIFADERYFVHHLALPNHSSFADEGAANHSRFCRTYGEQGIELFVYGFGAKGRKPHKFPPRQSLLAQQAITRLHQLADKNAIFVQQNPKAIDVGVFHNDVIAVANQNMLLYHENAFLHTKTLLKALDRFSQGAIQAYQIPAAVLSLEDAVNTYMFNSQLVTLPNNEMALILPLDCKHDLKVQQVLTELLACHTPVQHLHYVDCSQSLQNGGGPACLRLRVVLTPEEQASLPNGIWFTPELFTQLSGWIKQYYREYIDPDDLRDPDLVNETQEALAALERLRSGN